MYIISEILSEIQQYFEQENSWSPYVRYEHDFRSQRAHSRHLLVQVVILSTTGMVHSEFDMTYGVALDLVEQSYPIHPMRPSLL